MCMGGMGSIGCIPIAVLLAPLVWSDAALVQSTGKVIDFVNVLKHDLRKNNDDYYESLLSNTTALVQSSAKTTAAIHISQPDDSHDSLAGRFHYQKPIAPSGNVDTAKVNKRRSFNDVGSEYKEDDLATFDEEETHAREVPDVPAAPMIPTVPKSTQYDVTTATNLLETTRTTVAMFTKMVREQQLAANPHYRSQKKKSNKEKADRFKQFLQKNKGMLRDFVSKKMEAKTSPRSGPQQRALPPAASIPPKPETAGPLLKAFLETMRTAKTTSSPVESAGAGIDEMHLQLRQRNVVHRVQNKVTPNGDALDMMQAKGEQIGELRSKGRLCQRNVMLPEGPKYDSKGNIYLGAYTHLEGRDYSRTKTPRLLLPRCCNCCKKSVLGCE